MTLPIGIIRPSPLFTVEHRQLSRAGKKGMTRKPIKFPPGTWSPCKRPQSWGPQELDDMWSWVDMTDPTGTAFTPVRAPHGQPGDVWYLRETWRPVGPWECRPETVQYRDDGAYLRKTGWPDTFRVKTSESRNHWRPSTCMPRFAARTFLLVTDLKAERVQDISEEDAIAEGCRGTAFGDGPNGSEGILPSDQFATLWDSIYAKRPGCSWADNSWVWAYTFRLATPEEVAAAAKEPK